MRKGKLYILLAVAMSLLLLSPLGCRKIAEPTPEMIVKQAYAATMEVKSLHFSMSGTGPVTDGDESQGHIEGDFLSPDRMRVVIEADGQRQEVRCIGDKVYEWDSQTGEWRVLEGRVAQATLVGMQRFAEGAQPKSIAERLKGLEAIEELPDEVIDGVSCVHYRGRIDPLQGLREQLVKESDPRRKEALQQTLEMQEQMEMTIVVEVWIGKDDYLVWQQRVTQPQKFEGTTMKLTMVTKFSDFNEPVEIEAPL